MRDFDGRSINELCHAIRRKVRGIIEDDVDTLAKFRLEGPEKLNRDFARKRVSDGCKERLTGFGQCAEQVDPFVGFPVRQRDPLALRKPRVIQITSDGLPGLIHRDRRILLR